MTIERGQTFMKYEAQDACMAHNKNNGKRMEICGETFEC